MGYDGKGQVRVKTREELNAAWGQLQQVPCVLEKMLPLAYEVSVIVARGRDGQTVHFPLQQNLHRDGILAVTQVPAPNVTEAVSQQAYESAHQIAASLNYVGVLCIEFFVLADGRIVANEMAPRPHNSGHHTIDACDVSQFELQVRAMTGLPLVEPVLHSPCFMLNLLGDLWFPVRNGERVKVQQEPDWAAVLALSGTHLHLYGKTDARVGRKMGHLTITGTTPEAARATALKAAEILGIEPF
jgi:5-(carboxyamino)imidazole ribonucleotide synthase